MGNELSLKSIGIRILKQARTILLCMLGVGLFLAGYSALTAKYAVQKATPVVEKEQENLRALEIAEMKRDRAEMQVEGMKAYIENSLYYTIDAYNKGFCKLTFSIEGAAQAEKDMKICAAYETLYKQDAAIMKGLRQIIGTQADDKYVFELLGVQAVDGAETLADREDAGTTVTISVIHENADTAKKAAHYLYDEMTKRIQAQVAPFTTQILVDYAGYEMDMSMLRRQEEQSKLSDAEALLEEMRVDLDSARAAIGPAKEDMANKEESSEDRGMARIKRAVRYGMVGLVAGFILGCCIVLCVGVLNGYLENAEDARTRYRLPLLGVLPQDTKGRWFDRWIRRLENDPALSKEAAVEFIAANLRAAAADDPVLLLSVSEQQMLPELAQSFGGQVKAGGDIMRSAQAVQQLSEADTVVLVEKRGKAKLEQVDGEIMRLQALNKRIAGVILC